MIAVYLLSVFLALVAFGCGLLGMHATALWLAGIVLVMGVAALARELNHG